ncbi:unnamed protein product [Clavelina lepadiformis]|uniref:DNA topoisomerase n=2 Tax=Clavelina lepadiformis TaxID=159417 RepID=A0ABP0H0B5_CLALP
MVKLFCDKIRRLLILPPFFKQIMPRNASSYKVLNVAEKNDAAKRISDMLSGHQFQRREGFSKFNKIYEFDYYMLNKHCQMIMTSLSGHLLNYNFVGSYRKWSSCHPLSLFDAEIEKSVTENMNNIKKTIEKEIRSCQALLIWTDCDREGENIGFEIIDICQNVKPSISIYRAKFSEITERSVNNACRNLAQPDRRTSDAVDVRQELDLRIGAAFTRFQTLRLQKVFPQVLSNKLISYGSCQFPTLGFVVERYKAREQFQSERFWKIEVTHTQRHGDEVDQMQVTTFSWKRGRLFDELACKVLHENCIEPPAVAAVIDVNSRPRSRWRPVAMETVELEKLSSRKLKINAKETMKIAEKLYTQGYISYPRTETNIFPKDIDLRRLVEDQTQHPIWGDFSQRLLELDGGPTPRNGRSTDKAHPPIHPTKFTCSLTGNEAKIYELITRHFLACCHRDAQGHETTVEVKLGGEKFSAQGLMIIAKNYLEVYPYDRWNAKVIPVYNVGDEFEPTDVKMTQGATTAPPLLTEADLISLMDKHGIGTDATHAEHIETIKNRMYVELTNDQRFLPGELGLGLVEGYNMIGYKMSQPDLRAELEADLRKICEGNADKDQVLRNHIAKYRRVFEEALSKAEKLDEALSVYFGTASQVNCQVLNPSEVSTSLRPCPSCGKDMIIKRKKDDGFMVSCMGFPQCRNAAFLPKSVISINVDESVCGVCQPRPVHRVRLKLDSRNIPSYFDSEQVACIGGCDEDITNILGIRFKVSEGTAQSQNGQRHYSRHNQNNHRGEQGSGSRLSAIRGGGRGAARKRSASGKRKMSTSVATNADTGLENDIPECNCGVRAIELTVRKEGPNHGQRFFKCSKTNRGCGFFLWADAPVRRNNPSTSALTENQGHSSTTSGVTCRCSLPAVHRTVHREGTNKGRSFYACSKPRENGCGYFEWADQDNSKNPAGASRNKENLIGSDTVSRPSARGRKPPTCSLCHEGGHTRRGCPKK